MCSNVYSDKKNPSSPLLVLFGGIHRWPVESPHKGPVMWKAFPCEGASVIHIIFKAGSDSFVTHFSLLIIAHLIYNDVLKLPQAVLFSRDMIRFSVKNDLNTPVIFRPTFRYYATRTIVCPLNPSELLYENGLSCCADWLWEWWLKRLITVSFIWNASVYESWKSHWATCVRNFHSNDAHSGTVYKHDLWYYLIMGWSFNVIYKGTQSYKKYDDARTWYKQKQRL